VPGIDGAASPGTTPPEALQHYLHEHIPLSAAMAVSVLRATADEVVLKAPLAPNINHRATVFGGSASTLATLAAWSLVHLRCGADGVTAQLVIQHHGIDYDQPMAGDFTAAATLLEPDAWPDVLRLYRRRGRARVRVKAEVRSGDALGARFRGDFVLLPIDR